MSDIEVGEYIRTKGGYIGKVEHITKGYKFRTTTGHIATGQERYLLDNRKSISKPYVTKHSKDIIDLIEDGDLIEIEYYVRSKGKRIKRLFEVGILEGDKVYFDNVHCSLAYDIQNNIWLNKGFNPKILSILTHEQYEENCYKVGDIE